VLNYGVGGENTSDGLVRFRRVIRLVHPGIIIILEGVNDLLQGRSASLAARNLIAMVEITRSAQVVPVLVTVLPLDGARWRQVDPAVSELNGQIRAMARTRGVRVVDANRRFSSRQPLSALFRHADGREDGLHPNDAGYRLLAQSVGQALH
jgi:lysophospholipase L1-like esterase